MNETLQWILEMVDRISEPARTATEALSALRRELKSVDKLLKSVDARMVAVGNGMRNMPKVNMPASTTSGGSSRAAASPVPKTEKATKAATGGLLSTLMQLGKKFAIVAVVVGVLAGLAGTVANVASGLTRLGVALARTALDATSTRQRAISSLNALNRGDRAATEHQMQTIRGIANMFAMSVEDATESFVGLRASGFSEQEIPNLMQGMADLAQIPGGNAEAGIRALRQIRSKSVLVMEELNGQLGEAGLNLDPVLQILQDRHHTNRAGILRMISNKQIGSQEGTWAILESIRQNFSTGGRLGGLAQANATGLGAELTRLKNIWFELNANQGGALGFITNVIKSIREALDPATASGRRFAQVYSQLMNGIMGGAFGLNGATISIDDLIDAFSNVVPVITGVVRLLRSFLVPLFAAFSKVMGPALGLLGDFGNLDPILTGFTYLAYVLGGIIGIIGSLIVVLGVTAGSIVSLVGGLFWAVTQLGTIIYGAFLTFVDGMGTIGGNIIQGLINGMLSKAGAVRDTVTGIGRSIVSTVSGVLGIQSPSRVMMELGQQTVAGFALGIQSGDATGALGDLTASVGKGGGTSRSNSGVVMQVSITVDARGSDDPDAVGESVARAIKIEFANLFGGSLNEAST